VVVILEGESLVNDAAALVAYTVAVEAVVTGRFSLGETALRFVAGGLAGVVIGVAAGRAMAWALQRMEDPLLAITLVLFGAYFAYLPAELVGASAVLAAVAAGLTLGWLDPRADRPHIRVAGYAFWDELVFLLNALVFLAIGLELPAILDAVRGIRAPDLALWALAVPGVAIVLRILWVYVVLWAPERLERGQATGLWRECALKAWAGMRGVVSLAAALAIPLSTDAGAAFPDRDLVIFLAYATVVSTLVVHGMTLPVMLHLLRVGGDDDEEERSVARVSAAEAALRRADELDDEPWVPRQCLSELRRVYERRRRRYAARAHGTPDRGLEREAEACGRVRHELLEAAREAVVDLRERGVVSEDVHQEIQHDLDLADLRAEDQLPATNR
jgi:CPA1 family monovalent cation:H+ antiporter